MTQEEEKTMIDAEVRAHFKDAMRDQDIFEAFVAVSHKPKINSSSVQMTQEERTLIDG
jgi:hypothetical protein